MKHNVANILTLLRILLIPLIIGCMLTNRFYMATIFFGLAAITDGLDGYFARYFHQTSSFGAFLDPVADKLIVISVTIMLLTNEQFSWLAIPAIIIVLREVIISALREWMTSLGKQSTLRVSYLSKWKTATQMMAISLCLLSQCSIALFSVSLAYIAFVIATVLTVVSLIDYIWKAYCAF